MRLVDERRIGLGYIMSNMLDIAHANGDPNLGAGKHGAVAL